MKLAAHSNSCQAELVHATRRATASCGSQPCPDQGDSPCVLLVGRVRPFPDVDRILKIFPGHIVWEGIEHSPDSFLCCRHSFVLSFSISIHSRGAAGSI